MKWYVYWATEENCFEVEKNEVKSREDALAMVREYLETYDTENDINDIMAEFADEESDYTDFWSGDYVMFVGFAPQGKCRRISHEIRTMRNEMFGEY